jgi:hypothetical protein
MHSIRRAWSGKAKKDPWHAERALWGQRGDQPIQAFGEPDRRDGPSVPRSTILPPRPLPSAAGRAPDRPAAGEMPSPLLLSWTPAA